MSEITAVNNQNLQELRQKANHFVNMAFYGTLLREFRQASEPTILDGGKGSGAFTQMLDMELVDRMSQNGSSPLAEALLKQLGAARYSAQDLNTSASLFDAAQAMELRGDGNV
jgi:Rod binding domain-containing protein